MTRMVAARTSSPRTDAVRAWGVRCLWRWGSGSGSGSGSGEGEGEGEEEGKGEREKRVRTLCPTRPHTLGYIGEGSSRLQYGAASERHTPSDGCVRDGRDFRVGCIDGSFLVHTEVNMTRRDEDAVCPARVCECSGHTSHCRGGMSPGLSLFKINDSVSSGCSPL